MNTQARIALEKQTHPERFCPSARCLWRTTRLNHATGGGGYCPRHKQAPQSATVATAQSHTQIELGAVRHAG